MTHDTENKINELLGRVSRDISDLKSLFSAKLDEWNAESVEYKTSLAGKREGRMYARYLNELEHIDFNRPDPLHIRERNIEEFADSALSDYEDCDEERVESCAYLKGYYEGIVAAAEELCTEFTCDLENKHHAKI